MRTHENLLESLVTYFKLDTDFWDLLYFDLRDTVAKGGSCFTLIARDVTYKEYRDTLKKKEALVFLEKYLALKGYKPFFEESEHALYIYL